MLRLRLPAALTLAKGYPWSQSAGSHALVERGWAPGELRPLLGVRRYSEDGEQKESGMDRILK